MCLLFAFITEAEQLQPVFANLITGFVRYLSDQFIKIVTFEEGNPTALLTKQQMLVAIAGSDECLAALRLVNALDKAQFFQFFQSTIDADQPQSRIMPASRVVDLEGSNRHGAFGDDLNDGAARLREPIAILVQLVEPKISSHSLNDIENHFQ
jgi:hypothetical protein